MMKKILSMMLVCVMVVGMVTGCGSSDEQKTSSSTSDSGKKKLTAAANVDYAPFEFYEDGKPVGFDVDLWSAICDKLGYEAEFVHYPWDGLISGIQADKFDAIVADMEITDERKESVLFTDPYFYETIGIAKQAGSNINSLSDLKDQTIGLQTGTVAETWASKNESKIQEKEFTKYETMADALMDLEAGRTVAVINNGPYIQYQAKINDKIDVMDIIDDDPILCGIAFNKDDSELCNKVNGVLKELVSDGTYAKLYQKWFGADPNKDFMPGGKNGAATGSAAE